MIIFSYFSTISFPFLKVGFFLIKRKEVIVFSLLPKLPFFLSALMSQDRMLPLINSFGKLADGCEPGAPMLF